MVLPVAAEGHPLHDHFLDQEKVAAADAKAARPDFSPEFLDEHQLHTLDLLSERIVPGSTEARVAPFLDSLLSVNSPQDQRRFLGSLGAFEMLAFEHHSRPWKALTPAEQDALLTHASTAAKGKESASIRDFFDDLRTWIAGAYYSSEQGVRELGWTGALVFERFPGCDHPDGHNQP